MKLNALAKDWDVNEITFSQKREIHALNAKVWWGEGQDSDAYYSLLERVRSISGITERDFEDMAMAEVDSVLQAVFMRYMGLDQKKNGV